MKCSLSCKYAHDKQCLYNPSSTTTLKVQHQTDCEFFEGRRGTKYLKGVYNDVPNDWNVACMDDKCSWTGNVNRLRMVFEYDIEFYYCPECRLLLHFIPGFNKRRKKNKKVGMWNYKRIK